MRQAQGVQMASTNARAVYDHHRLFAQDADPQHALRLGPTQPSGPGSPSNTVMVSTAG